MSTTKLTAEVCQTETVDFDPYFTSIDSAETKPTYKKLALTPIDVTVQIEQSVQKILRAYLDLIEAH